MPCLIRVIFAEVLACHITLAKDVAGRAARVLLNIAMKRLGLRQRQNDATTAATLSSAIILRSPLLRVTPARRACRGGGAMMPSSL